MRYVLAYILAGTMLLLLGLVRADAQEICLPLDKLREALKQKFNEDEVGGGIVSESAITLLFASPDGDTWTIAMLTPDGKACVVAGGSDWFHDRIPGKDERPA